MRDVLNFNPLIPYGSRFSNTDESPGGSAAEMIAVNPSARGWPESTWTNVPITPSGYRAGIGRLAAQPLAGPHYLREYTA